MQGQKTKTQEPRKTNQEQGAKDQNNSYVKENALKHVHWTISSIWFCTIFARWATFSKMVCRSRVVQKTEVRAHAAIHLDTKAVRNHDDAYFRTPRPIATIHQARPPWGVVFESDDLL